MEYRNLKERLDLLPLLEDEKKMWLRIGFYIPIESEATTVYAIDYTGRSETLSKVAARNMRVSIINWWQVEKIKPRSSEPSEPIDNTGLSSLENRND